MKPDVVVPVTSIGSASNGSTCLVNESVAFLTGTSMAAPAVAGALALVSQYIAEAHWHRIPNAPGVSNALLRAFIVQAADRARPTESEGYGLPNLERALVFESDFGKRGLRFVSGTLAPENEVRLFVATNTGSAVPLVVTLVWNDLAVALVNDSLLPIVVDLDLVVIAPDGRATYGNMGKEEESLSTARK
jgi:subtilisin family serine protease